MNIKEEIDSLKKRRDSLKRVKRWKKKNGDIITASDMMSFITETGCMPVNLNGAPDPIYNKENKKMNKIKIKYKD